MPNTKCYVVRKDGTYTAEKSNPKKNDGKFVVDGATYDAPRLDAKEILSLVHPLLGMRRFAFYRVGTPTPIPLDSNQPWRTIHNPDDDKDFLASVIKAALLDKKNVEIQLKATLVGQAVIVLLLLLHWIF